MIEADLERWRAAQQWLARLLDLAPDDRAQALDAAGLEPGLQASVQRLLAAADHPDPRLEPDIGGLALEVDAAEPRNGLAGRRVGDWELLEEIGRGGMSVVYRARRMGADFEQEAAVKLLAMASLGTGGAQRFEQERSILARLRHPHIAGLIDAGSAADGTPWLAMALVDGEHVDQWCEQRAIGLEGRVRLMAQVCDAVAHAHRHMVVHRDIKPGNLLVTPAGVPILLDFGIAKLLQVDAESTRTGTRALTPGYAAPEQLAGGDITPATDVFALGCVLRRLCAGCGPLPRDLRNVIALATREEPTRRYRDAQALGEDLQRWLRRQTVAATPDTAGYRLRMFVRRRRGAAIGTAVAVLLLVAGVAATLWQAGRATTQARRAEASRDFLVDLLLAADPERSGAEPSLSTLVDRGMQRVDAAFTGSPSLHAEFAMLLGHLAMVSGDHARAGALLAGAYARSLEARDPLLQSEVLYRQALLANRRGEPRAAIDSFQAALAVPGLPAAAAASLRRRSLPDLSYAVENTGDLAGAQALSDESLAAAQADDAALGPDQRARLLMAAARLGRQPAQERALLEQAAAWFDRGAPTPYERMGLEAQLATAHYRAGEHDAAIVRMQRAASMADAVYRHPSAQQARLHNNLGSMLRTAGRLAEAQPALARAEELFRAVGDHQSPAFAALLNNRGGVLLDLAEPAAAVQLLDESVALAERHFGTADPRVGIALATLARARAESGDARGEADWQRAWQIAGRTGDASRQVNVLTLGALTAAALGDAGRSDERIHQARSAAAGAVPDGRWQLYLALAQAGGALQQRDLQGARSLLAQALAGEQVRQPSAWVARWRLHRAQGDVLRELGDTDAARVAYREALGVLEANGIAAGSRAHDGVLGRLDALTATAARP